MFKRYPPIHLPWFNLPLSFSRPRVQDFLPLVNRCEKRLGGISTYLKQEGKLKLVNVVFSSLPTFYICCFTLPNTIIMQIDKFRKHFLWRGSDLNERKPPKAAWKLVCVPKDEGGLGIIDIEKQNKALLLKNLHKFFNKTDLPRVHLVPEKHYRNGKLPSHTKKDPSGGAIFSRCYLISRR